MQPMELIQIVSDSLTQVNDTRVPHIQLHRQTPPADLPTYVPAVLCNQRVACASNATMRTRRLCVCLIMKRFLSIHMLLSLMAVVVRM